MSAIYLRKATEKDLPSILDIIDSAKKYLKEQNIDQWQTGYPHEDDIKEDIKNGVNYVLIVGNQVAGTATLGQGLDLSYLKIKDGQWENPRNSHYTAIHRVAISNNFRGKKLSQKMMSGMITISLVLGYRDIRIDTHPDNKGMQHVITSNGFEKRGIVKTADGDQHDPLRYAYQLVID
ncbi:N-acetyltransferase [Philodulcilactobacillus myokoensis]|uniref:N-acetyltransferase n=1 Tax=Philodulcilactobacillus myokoensis TaxID=2929573 RepID=A0A9W6ESC9_9LACO|nr:GNAT family N-acetyltransferase [Philodulcilactobacillus myokoensis]GLB46029.1 N-acetyltransferase [Philodulcilactobacillus myokoensis]